MSARSDALAAQLAVLKSRAERRDAVERFERAQMSTQDVRAVQALRSWLASPGQSRLQFRAAEGSGSTGGNLLPGAFFSQVITQTREYDGLLRALELWESTHGLSDNRPVRLPVASSQFGVLDTENTTSYTSGQDMVLATQAWPVAPIRAASTQVSNQVVMDSFAPVVTPGGGSPGGWTALPANPHNQPTSAALDYVPAPFVGLRSNPQLDALVAESLGESLGRVMAPLAATTLYGAITAVGATSAQNGGFVTLAAATPVSYITGSASTELIQNTINIDTAALLVGALDVSYHDGASFYFSSQQWQNLVRQVDAQKHLQLDPGLGLGLFGFPVCLTSQTSTAAASTVAGPLFGNLEKAATFRVASDEGNLLRSSEKLAEFLATYYQATLRADVAVRDARAVVGVKYAAT